MSNKEDILKKIRQLILDVIYDKQGIKATKLSTVVFSYLYDSEIDITPLKDELKLTDLWMGIIEELIKEGEIVEIEYNLPNMEYRTKSFYLPKGTTVNIVNKPDIELQDADIEEIYGMCGAIDILKEAIYSQKDVPKLQKTTELKLEDKKKELSSYIINIVRGK